MTPYECALAKKLNQAIEINDNLSRSAGASHTAPEALILQALIQQVEIINQQFDSQLLRYQDIYEKRMRLAAETDGCIKELTNKLWEDIDYQFEDGTLSKDLIKTLHRKIYRLPLHAFPDAKRKPVLHKDVHVHEDSFALLGRYFGWLIDLLAVVNFRPIRSPFCLNELRQRANQFTAFSQQAMNEAETLRSIQFTQNQLYKQLTLAMSAARNRLLTCKIKSQRVTR